jgi:hypothetical protein
MHTDRSIEASVVYPTHAKPQDIHVLFSLAALDHEPVLELVGSDDDLLLALLAALQRFG